MNENLMEKLIGKAEKLGASYVDVRYQENESEVILVENKILKSYTSRKRSGIGIRVIVDKSLGYASTSKINGESLEQILREAVKIARVSGIEVRGLGEGRVEKAEEKSLVKVNPFEIDPDDKVSVALEANKSALISDEIKNIQTALGIVRDSRLFMSSLGSKIKLETTIIGVSHGSVARVNGRMERVSYSNSKCAGFEFIEKEDWNSFTIDISKLALEAVNAKTPPPGTYTVVVDPDVIGLMLHEAFGHASEGDLVASGESVLHGMLGKRVASELVTIIDEGVVENGYFHPYDDEGVKKEKTVIVENGILKNYIHSITSATLLGAKPTGNGRAQDFENLPIVRQTNYYMAPGDYSFEELIEDIDFGIYIKGKGAGGGQVEVGMGTFTFGVGPSKIIRKGELAETVRGVVISGLILETLKTIDAIGKDLKIRTNVFGGCGKMGQSVRVGFGGPHVRVRKMTVGGR
ncbi:MAG: TldD/PmbA family protein [archaeon GB-1867-035]|nr:TldD/PmbA family protein [Candidatus Culexmicrobium profundum]